MKSFILFFLCFTFIITQAQVGETLYMPLEFQQAYQKGTRKMDGSVSPTYWQNRSVYRLQADIDPGRKLLSGKASITYFNNSPDTILNPTFHTYPDYYRPGAERSGFFAGSSGADINNDGMVIEKLVIDGITYNVANPEEVRDGGTFRIVRLKKPLLPKDKMELDIHWHFTIPGKGFERSGAIDSTSMFIGYWYPEMAVLDDINGWDRIVYNAATEFYHDYSDYEVTLTLPDNFTVWASVQPQNEKEVYSPKILERLAQARKSTTAVNIFTEADINRKSSGKKTWKYTARNYPDFAFALSDHYLWNAAHYKDGNGDYFFQAAYPPNHPEFSTVVHSIAKSLQIFHTEFPVYPFPHQYFTIFNGLEGGGMEFPGMANNDNTTAAQIEQWTGIKMSEHEANLGLTLHEMFHMYFPFLMGINEKHYAWMDEGLADFAEYFLPEWPKPNYDQNYLATQSVLPMMAPSHAYQNSGLNSYTIAAQSYNALYSVLGKDGFNKCMKAYITTWQYKHPTPYDFMFTFNRESGMDLNWFWKKWYFDWGYIDLGIQDFSGNAVTIDNVGGRPIPFSVIVHYDDGTQSVKEFKAHVWKDTKRMKYTISSDKKRIRSIELDIPGNGDAVFGNNVREIK